ncbi:MAG: S-adenosylmethionine:tRNA ribosyltransferase-isomerase [Bacteroidetes bacterium]|nr:S-adenosylmethionine:tRNA ribosyltransferase-isomerase [Bacteroidota bacterium]
MSIHPSFISITDYTYDLPQEKIANYPLANRDASKLLLYKNGEISETGFKNIADNLEAESVLIFNNTRVVQARLNFLNTKGQAIEVFCLEPFLDDLDITQAMLSTQKVNWKCLVGNLKKWRDEELVLTSNDITLKVKLLEKRNEDVVVEFLWEPSNLSFAEVLERTGAMPIPPYLKRKSEELDAERYQTIYAQKNGSVAAPTAGLHFTPEVNEKLKIKNISSVYVTLHVGAGTFKPVKSDTLAGHDMHAEWIDVSKTTIQELQKSETKKKIAVGTTSLRTIESLYWLGAQVFYDPSIPPVDLEIRQWLPYEFSKKEITATESLTALIDWLDKNKLQQLSCKTAILLAPPYQLKLADGIITNFHQPQSTLLLLISCIVGNSWKDIYKYALEHDFRFLSYGDSSLLLK